MVQRKRTGMSAAPAASPSAGPQGPDAAPQAAGGAASGTVPPLRVTLAPPAGFAPPPQPGPAAG